LDFIFGMGVLLRILLLVRPKKEASPAIVPDAADRPSGRTEKIRRPRRCYNAGF